MFKKLLFAGLIIITSVSSINAQEQTQFKSGLAKHYTNKVDLDFNNSVTDFQVVDAFTNQNLTFSKNQNNVSIEVNYPGEILKVIYSENNIIKTETISSKSASTGEIKVYFNHIVDTSVATPGNNAVNLGNTLDDKLIATINACTETLDIAVYSSSSPSATTGIAGAINNAYARGVIVRLIYDSTTTSNMIGFLNPSIPILPAPIGVAYGIMHNKFVIFDANSIDASKPLVWAGSTNWSISQIDGPDKNNVITIQDQALALGYKLEFEEMWGSSTAIPNTTISKFGPYKTDNTPHNYIIGGKNVESYFSPSDGTNAKIINTINTANSDINIATMLITRSDIASAIINKYNSGILNTNLVVDTQNPTGNQFLTIQAGILPNHDVKDVLTGIMHHKFMVIDNSNPASDPLVWTGSHNWSSSAETKNDENSLVVHDANIANQYYQAFYYLYNQASGVLNINDNIFSENNITIYPNPVTDIVTLKYNSEINSNDLSITISDMLGKVMYYKTSKAFNSEEINLSNQQSGIYFLTLKSANNSKTIKLIKN